MASENDKAVLWTIFNPTSPFGEIPGLNQEEEPADDGMFWVLYQMNCSLSHVMDQFKN